MLLSELNNEFVEEYKNILIDIENNIIQSYELGYIPNQCIPLIFSILVHCQENINIFNDEQKININNLITNFYNEKRL